METQTAYKQQLFSDLVAYCVSLSSGAIKAILFFKAALNSWTVEDCEERLPLLAVIRFSDTNLKYKLVIYFLILYEIQN